MRCGICRNLLTFYCIECEATSTSAITATSATASTSAISGTATTSTSATASISASTSAAAAASTTRAEYCSVLTGFCQHAFHTHCIQRWLQTSAACPLCARQWFCC